MLQGYEDDPEPDDEDEEDASYADADEDYAVASSTHAKKKAPKKTSAMLEDGEGKADLEREAA